MDAGLLQAQYEADTRDVIGWLESPEGERWSRGQHHHGRLIRLFTVIPDGTPSDTIHDWLAVWRA